MADVGPTMIDRGTAYASRRKVEKYWTAADPLGVVPLVVPANFISLKNFDIYKRPRDERNIRRLKFY